MLDSPHHAIFDRPRRRGQRPVGAQIGSPPPGPALFYDRIHSGLQPVPEDYWVMNDTSSPVIDEISGLDMTGSGGLTYSQAPMRADLGDSIAFDGSGQLVNVDAGLNGAIHASVFAWVQTTGTGEMVIIQQRNGGFEGEWVLGTWGPFGSTAGHLYAWGYDNQNTFEFVLESSGVINDGEPHFVAFSLDQNDTTARLWVDGALDAVDTTPDGGTFNPSLSVAIGYDIRDGNKGWVGEISNVGIALDAWQADYWAYLYN